MEILYGVTGVGMGHAIRSKIIIQHLLKKGHKVIIFSYGPAFEFLKHNFKNVHKLEGLELFYDNNVVHVSKTLLLNLIKYPKKFLLNLPKFLKYSPQFVITDFEPMTYRFAKRRKIKVIGVDNINVIKKIKNPNLKNKKAKFLANLVASIITPKCDYYLIPSFFKQAKYPNIKVLPPILRPEIIRLKPRVGKHILVYLTSKNYEKQLLKILPKINKKFIVYGFNKSLKTKNITFKNFSEKGFIKDLKNSHSVICYGGFSLISEALYLKKPVLTLPIKDHYEQLLNADFVRSSKFGISSIELSFKVLNSFLIKSETFRKNLLSYGGVGNKELFKELDALLK